MKNNLFSGANELRESFFSGSVEPALRRYGEDDQPRVWPQGRGRVSQERGRRRRPPFKANIAAGFGRWAGKFSSPLHGQRFQHHLFGKSCSSTKVYAIFLRNCRTNLSDFEIMIMLTRSLDVQNKKRMDEFIFECFLHIQKKTFSSVADTLIRWTAAIHETASSRLATTRSPSSTRFVATTSPFSATKSRTSKTFNLGRKEHISKTM